MQSAPSFAQSNCLTNEEIKKVWIALETVQFQDSILQLKNYQLKRLRDQIENQATIMQTYQDKAHLNERKIALLTSQAAYADKAYRQEVRKRKAWQVGSAVGAAAIGGLLLLR